jgi:hypothetical protein
MIVPRGPKRRPHSGAMAANKVCRTDGPSPGLPARRAHVTSQTGDGVVSIAYMTVFYHKGQNSVIVSQPIAGSWYANHSFPINSGRRPTF